MKKLFVTNKKTICTNMWESLLINKLRVSLINVSRFQTGDAIDARWSRKKAVKYYSLAIENIVNK